MVTACSPRTSVRQNLVWSGLAAGSLGLAMGLAQSDAFAQIAWARVQEMAAWATALLALSWTAARMSGRRMAVTLLWLWLPLSLWLHGPVACLAVALVALLSSSLGDRLGVSARQYPVLACVAGLAALAGVGGWLQGAAVFQRVWVLLALLLTLLLLRANLLEVLAGARTALGRLSRLDGRDCLPVLLVTLALLASGHPTLHFDDLAYHAALPTQLLAGGHNRLDAHGQIWALAPWSGDVLHGLVAVLSGELARGALNQLWWLLLGAGLVELGMTAQLPARAMRWAVALAASLPLSWMLLGGMQSELAAAVAIVALLTLLQTPGGAVNERGRAARTLGLLVGLLLGLKISNLVFVGPLAVAALTLAPRRTLRALPWALPLALLAGGSSYAYAWTISGNPLLPLFNGWFASDLLPATNLFDARYRDGFDFSDFYGALFDSSRYAEAWDGVAGFQWLLLAIPGLLGLIYARTGPGDGSGERWIPLRWALIAIALGAVLLFWQMQYLRYLYPTMVAGGIAIGCGVSTIGGSGAGTSRLSAAFGVALALCLSLNLLFVANVHWQLRQGLTPSGLRGAAAEQSWIDQVAPELRLMAIANDRLADSNVLLADPEYPYIASGLGHAFTTAWYDPQLQVAYGRCRAERSVGCWRKQLRTDGFDWLISRADGNRDPALAEALAGWADLAATVGPAELYRLPLRTTRTASLYQARAR